MNAHADRLKICLVISSMGPGGAERVVSLLANYWVDHETQVDILTLSKDPSFYELSRLVGHRKLDLLRASRNPLQGFSNSIRRISKLRHEIKEIAPDVVISFMDKTNVLVLLACKGLRVPIIVSERTFPGSYDIGCGWRLLRKLAYKSATTLVAATSGMKDKLQELGFSNIVAIPNPAVAPARAEVSHRSNSGRNTILSAGRFCHEKGFDILIRAFSEVHHRHPDWRLRIVGDGDNRVSLERLVKEYELDSSVDLPGFTQDIYSELRRAEIFVLSSRNEGFPNVLVEAMSVGNAVLATDCDSGPNEIITHENDGLLIPVDDVDRMASALSRLIEDADLRRKLGTNAKAIVARFSIESVMTKWERVIETACGKSKVQSLKFKV